MRIRHYEEHLKDGLLTLEANDGVVCLREAPLGPYKDAIALHPCEGVDAPDFYAMLIEQGSVVGEVTEYTPLNEVDQIRDFKANLEDILQEKRADWRLVEVDIYPDRVLLEYESTTGQDTQLLHVDYGGGLDVRFRMAPTVFGYPAVYELHVIECTPGEDGGKDGSWSSRRTYTTSVVLSGSMRKMSMGASPWTSLSAADINPQHLNQQPALITNGHRDVAVFL